MPFVIFFSALLFLFGLVLLLRGTADSCRTRRKKAKIFSVVDSDTRHTVRCDSAVSRTEVVCCCVPALHCALGHLFLRLPLASIFWVIVYQLLAMMRVSSASPSATSRKVRGFVMTPTAGTAYSWLVRSRQRRTGERTRDKTFAPRRMATRARSRNRARQR